MAGSASAGRRFSTWAAFPSESIVLKARQTGSGAQAPFAPAPIDEVVAAILEHKPDVVFAPHVETSSGMMLPDDYLKAVGDAVHAVDGLFVLDCIASGTVWVDMAANNVDVLISAPQKGLERFALLRLRHARRTRPRPH
jgi:aspartate aminotransferase-like enzyme